MVKNHTGLSIAFHDLLLIVDLGEIGHAVFHNLPRKVRELDQHGSPWPLAPGKEDVGAQILCALWSDNKRIAILSHSSTTSKDAVSELLAGLHHSLHHKFVGLVPIPPSSSSSSSMQVIGHDSDVEAT
jgi:hypothetical protein